MNSRSSSTEESLETTESLVDQWARYRAERLRNPDADAALQRKDLIEALCRFCRLASVRADLDSDRVGEAARDGSLPIARSLEDLLLLVSDPASIEFPGNHDHWYRLSFEELSGAINAVQAAQLLAAGLLKYMGRFDAAAAVYESLTDSPLARAHGSIGLGDLHLLSALHARHLREHEGVWPFPREGAARAIADVLRWSRGAGSGFEAAERYFAEAAAEMPSLPMAHYARAVLERARNQKTAAADAYAKACRCAPEPARATLLAQEQRQRPSYLPLEESPAHPRGFVGFVGEEATLYAYNLYDAEGLRHVQRELLSRPLYAYQAHDAWPLSPGLTSICVGDQLLSDTLMFTGREREIWDPSLAVSDGRHVRYGKGAPTPSDRPVVLLPGLGSFYFHFLYDAVGSLAVVPRASWQGRDLVFSQQPVGGTTPTSWQNEILSMLGAPPGVVHRGEILYRDAIVCSYPSQNNTIVPGAVRFLRAQLGRPGRPNPGKRIFFTRTAGRALAAGPALKLRALAEAYGFRCLDPMRLTVRQQRQILSECGVFMCEAGSGLANTIFLPEGAKVVTLGTRATFKDYFCPVTAILGQEMHVVLSDVDTMYPRHQFHWSAFIPRVDFDALRNCLDLVAPRPRVAAFR